MWEIWGLEMFNNLLKKRIICSKSSDKRQRERDERWRGREREQRKEGGRRKTKVLWFWIPGSFWLSHEVCCKQMAQLSLLSPQVRLHKEKLSLTCQPHNFIPFQCPYPFAKAWPTEGLWLWLYLPMRICTHSGKNMYHQCERLPKQLIIYPC